MARIVSTSQVQTPSVAVGDAAGAVHQPLPFDSRPATEKLPPTIVEAVPGKPVLIPGAEGLLEGADYQRVGADLILEAPDGTRILVRDYFASDSPGDLISETGATIDGDLAMRLAGSMTPGQWVQAKGAGALGQSIGRADTLSGDVQVVHADGSKGLLHKGDPVYQGDVLQTPKGASIGLVFMDGTNLALGGNGRLVLDQMVYDPVAHTGKSAFSLVQGTFSFVSGEIAKVSPDAASIKTPVATIGIRGTMVAGGYSPQTGLTTALLPEANGVGEFTVTNAAGTITNNTANGALHVGNFFTPPSNIVTVTSAQLSNSFGTVLQQVASSSSNSNASQSAQQILNQATQQGAADPQAPAANGQNGPAAGQQQGPQGPAAAGQQGPAQPGAAPAQAGAAAPAATVEGIFQGAAQGAGPQAPAAGFAQAAQQAINAALNQGISIDQAVQGAMQAHQAYTQAVNQGASAQQALNAAGLAAQQSGVLTATPFANVPVTAPAPANTGPSSQNGPGSGNDGGSTSHNDSSNLIRVTLNTTTGYTNQGGSGNQGTTTDPYDNVTDNTGTTTVTTVLTTTNLASTEEEPTSSSNNIDNNAPNNNVTTTEPTVVTLSGKAIDGYISGATVFLDADNDGSLDTGETWTLTDSQGNYTLSSTDTTSPVVLFGGTDISTNRPLVGTLKAPAGSTVVTPLTTMVQSMVASGLSEASAQSQVALMLGISNLPDLTDFDPVAQSSSASSSTVTQAAEVMKAAVMVQNMVTQMSAMMVGAGGVTTAAATSAIFSALATQATSASGAVNFATSANVSTLIDSVASNLSLTGNANLATAKATISSVIASVNTAVNTAFSSNSSGGASLLTALANVATVAQGSATTAIQDAFNNTATLAASLTTLGSDYSGTSLTNAITSAASGLEGTTGDDTITGTAGSDVIRGLAGIDTLSGLGGDDSLYGGDGNDLLKGGTGTDILDGGAGTDTVSYVAATSGIVVDLSAGSVTGGDGNDTLSNIEIVIASEFSDTMTGTTGADTLYGGAGDDSLTGDEGNDILDGGTGTDTVLYLGKASGVTVNLTTGTATGSNGSDTLTGFENVTGTSLADVLTGSSVANTLKGEGGNDTLIGMAGNDSLSGGTGDDILYGDSTSSITGSGTLVNGLGGSSGFGENSVTRGDDGYYSQVSLSSIFPSGLTWFGQTYSSIWANTNGHATFGQGYSTYSASGYPMSGTSSPPILAPLFYDVDTRSTSGLAATPGGNSTGSNLVWYDVDSTNGIVTITWDDVGFYSQNNSALNAFQLQIYYQGAAGDYDVAFRYETVNYSYYDEARAGWSASDGVAGHYYELPASSSSSVLNLETALGNTGTAGLWTWSFRNGVLSSSGETGSSGSGSVTGDDVVAGGAGNDTLYGGAGNDTLSGDGDSDVLYGGLGADTLDGGTENDSLIGGGGADTLQGGAGNDTLTYQSDAASFDGGTGADTLLFQGSGVTLDLSSSTISFANLEKVDLTGSGNNRLELTATKVFGATEASNDLLTGIDISNSHVLVIGGNSGDQLVFDDLNWVSSQSSISLSGDSYSVYTNANSGSATAILVDSDITVSSGLS